MSEETKPLIAPLVPGHMYVDATPTGEVVFTTIEQNDEMSSHLVYMTPRVAAKLGQQFINVAAQIERP
jgi:hypothetical protein